MVSKMKVFVNYLLRFCIILFGLFYFCPTKNIFVKLFEFVVLDWVSVILDCYAVETKLVLYILADPYKLSHFR